MGRALPEPSTSAAWDAGSSRGEAAGGTMVIVVFAAGKSHAKTQRKKIWIPPPFSPPITHGDALLPSRNGGTGAERVPGGGITGAPRRVPDVRGEFRRGGFAPPSPGLALSSFRPSGPGQARTLPLRHRGAAVCEGAGGDGEREVEAAVAGPARRLAGLRNLSMFTYPAGIRNVGLGVRREQGR